MDANPDLGKPWQQWALANAIIAAAQSATADFRTEILHQRSTEPPAHEITAARLVRGAEKVWCRCGAVLPIERNGDGMDEVVSNAFRQHLAEHRDG